MSDKTPTPPEQPNLSCLGNYERDPCIRPSCPIKVKCREYTQLRSRPATAPTFCDKISGGYECAGVKNTGNCPRDTAIRNATLDILKSYFEGYKEAADKNRDAITVFATEQHLEVIESLRQQSTEARK